MGSCISHPGPPRSIEIELLHEIGDGFHNVSCHCGRVVMHLRCDVCLHISVSLCVCTYMHTCVRACMCAMQTLSNAFNADIHEVGENG